MMKISFRCISDENRLNFANELREFNWDSVENLDIDKYGERFVAVLNELYCKHFPLKTKYVPSKNNLNPWLTPHIRSILSAKSEYFSLFRMGFVTRIENNRFKNKVKRILNRAKIAYYRMHFNNPEATCLQHGN